MGAFRQAIPATSIQLAVTPGDILYTCPAGTKAQIIALQFINTSAGSVNVTVHVVRSGGAIANNNMIWNAVPIPAATTAPSGRSCYEALNIILNPGDFIRAFASGATAITPTGGVVEFT